MTPPTSTNSLRGRVILAASYLVGAKLVSQVISVLSLVVLARLLTPNDYGIFAIATLFTGLVGVITNFQFKATIIRIPEVEDAHFGTLFTLAVVRGALCSAALFFGADAATALMGAPEAGPVLRWLALVPLIDGLRNPYFAIYAKNVDFSREAAIEISSRVVGTILTITFAITLQTYWAFVVGSIGTSIYCFIYTYYILPKRPFISVKYIGLFMSFGGWLSGASIVNYLNHNSDRFIVGAHLGPATLGLYQMGVRLATMATYQLALPITRAAFPGFAQLRNGREQVRRAYLNTQTGILAMALPIGVGVALTAPELVRVFAGEKWASAAPIVQWLTPILAVGLVQSGAEALIMAHGQTRDLFKRSVFNFCMRVPATILGLYMFGLFGVVYARMFSNMASSAMTLHLVRKVTGGPMGEIFLRAWRSFASCLAMTGAVLAVDAQLGLRPDDALTAATMLCVKTAVGGAVYATCHAALWLLSGRPDGPESVIARMGTSLWRRVRSRISSRINRPAAG